MILAWSCFDIVTIVIFLINYDVNVILLRFMFLCRGINCERFIGVIHIKCTNRDYNVYHVKPVKKYEKKNL